MRIARRLLTLALAASGLLIAGASTAAAKAPSQPYPIPPPVVTVDSATVVVGESIAITGQNFGPREPVDVTSALQTATGQLGNSARRGLVAVPPLLSTIADDNGAFSVRIVLDEVGLFIHTATGRTTGRSGSVTVRVLPTSPPTGPPTPVVININKTIIVKGDIIIVTGCNFQPGESVNVVSALEGISGGRAGRSASRGLALKEDGTTVADNIGCFSFNVRPDKAGKHRVDAVGEKTGRRGTKDVEVVDASAALPVTGNDGSNMTVLLIGSAVAAMGIVLLVLARSRRRSAKMDS
jgi:LPXTG-motif cell wall-anchored protein